MFQLVTSLLVVDTEQKRKKSIRQNYKLQITISSRYNVNKIINNVEL